MKKRNLIAWVIVRDPILKETKTLRYHVYDLIKFTQFLDQNWPNWKFYNVFDKSSMSTKNMC
jgi:hypothetical protein